MFTKIDLIIDTIIVSTTAGSIIYFLSGVDRDIVIPLILSFFIIGSMVWIAVCFFVFLVSKRLGYSLAVWKVLKSPFFPLVYILIYFNKLRLAGKPGIEMTKSEIDYLDDIKKVIGIITPTQVRSN